MIRNIPPRCKEQEIVAMLSIARVPFKLEMPKGAAKKCKGFAFVTAQTSDMLRELALALWQRPVPARFSNRRVLIHPADIPLDHFAGRDVVLEL